MTLLTEAELTALDDARERQRERLQRQADADREACAPGPSDSQKAITRICREIESILLEKNRAYGDSALNPVRIFSKADPLEQINVRLDDKISRMARGHAYGDEDTELDLIGYLVLRRIARELQSTNPSKDPQ